MLLLLITLYVCFNDGSYTYLHPSTGIFAAIHLSLCSPNICMEIDFMVESDSCGSDHFSYCLKIEFCFPIYYPAGIDWVQFDKLCEEKLTLDTIELYE